MKEIKNRKARDAIGKWGGLIDEYLYVPVVYWLLDSIKLRIRPEYVAFFNLFLVVWNAYLFSMQQYVPAVWAAIVYLWYSLRDILDWALARYWWMTNIYGIYLDSFIDVLSETIILIGLCIYFDVPIIVYAISLFPAFTAYTLLQEKHLLKKTTKQLNMFDYLPLQFRDLKKMFISLIVVFTRNDFRKVFILLAIVFHLPVLLFIYFSMLYLLAIWRSVSALVQTSRQLE